jgi:O-methyltransferase
MIGKLGRAANTVLGQFNLHLSKMPSRDSRDKADTWSHEQSPEFLHSHVTAYATYSPWLTDREFLNTYTAIKGSTLVDMYRCYELWSLAKQSNLIDGSILEVGVWRGGTGCILALASPTKTVYLADTFQGVVKVGSMDTRYVGGEHADTSEQSVRDLLASLGAKNAQLLTGIFPDETSANLSGPISLLHVDVDVYQSGRDIVNWALPRLPVGATIVFDDYGFSGCEGIARLANELRQSLSNFSFIHNLNGHAIFIRHTV